MELVLEKRNPQTVGAAEGSNKSTSFHYRT